MGGPQRRSGLGGGYKVQPTRQGGVALFGLFVEPGIGPALAARSPNRTIRPCGPCAHRRQRELTPDTNRARANRQPRRHRRRPRQGTSAGHCHRRDQSHATIRRRPHSRHRRQHATQDTVKSVLVGRHSTDTGSPSRDFGTSRTTASWAAKRATSSPQRRCRDGRRAATASRTDHAGIIVTIVVEDHWRVPVTEST